MLRKNGPKTCGICGSKGPLTKTSCCDELICDDIKNDQGVPVEQSECRRNHEKYTLCHHHYRNEHEGDWKECKECRDSFDTEMYVYYGTNEYNVEVLDDPPDYAPTECAECGTVVDRSRDAHQMTQDGILCADCCEIDPRHLG